MNKLKALLLCKNLFALAPNGGSRVYESIVKSNPSIEFFSYSDLKCDYINPKNLNLININPSNVLQGVEKMLYEVRDNYFDVIDWPDWIVSEIDPRGILARHRIKFRKLCVSLHGNNSLVLSTSPFKEEMLDTTKSLKRLETSLYKSCDTTYGISKYYAKKLGVLTKFHCIDPANFIKKFPSKNTHKPSDQVIFLGRRESTKGYGNYLDLLRASSGDWTGAIFGPDSYSWREYRYWNQREYEVRNRIAESTTLSEDEVTMKLHARQGSYVYLSEFDSFNLACADSISSGQSVITYDDIPALLYFKENGIALCSTELNRSDALSNSLDVDIILKETKQRDLYSLETMRTDIQEMLGDKINHVGYMEDIYS